MKKTKTKKSEKKMLSLLLVAAMLFALPKIPVQAETLEKEADAAEMLENVSNVAKTAEKIMKKAADAEEELEEAGTAEELPEDPVHTCSNRGDGSDTTKWSYVYFGSYPQSEVTGDALTAAITGASYSTSGDAWVNGTKYRRISKSDTNYGGYFGDSAYRYFKWERIKWRVLKVSGSTIFVASDKGLDCKDYNEEYTSVTWETCTLRNWLNNYFYDAAFSGREQEAIVSQIIVNGDNPYHNTEGGNDTQDKVFLLSVEEATNPSYGFCEVYDLYSVSRRMKASDYAHAKGADVSATGYPGNCWWWLRSPGSSASGFESNFTGNAAGVNSGGCGGSYMVDFSRSACVPALHINFSSDLWFMSDDGTSGDGGSEKETGNNTDLKKPSNLNQNIGLGNSQITPKETVLKGKITAKSKAFTVKWEKQPDVSGYQIQYSANKNFKKKGTKTKTVKKPSKTKLTVKKLKSGKKYYVRIRTYKTAGSTTLYSGWSKAKTVKIKK